MIKIIKKDGTLEKYDIEKIKSACLKSAARSMSELSEKELSEITNKVNKRVEENLKKNKTDKISVLDMHAIVERTLIDLYPEVGECYRQYRNYKLDFVKMLDDVYNEAQRIRYIGDNSNANTDASMVSTQRSLIYGSLNKQLYTHFFLNKMERQAINDGYIYVHDMKDRLDCVNCMLFDMANVLKGGFEMGNLFYNEPQSLDVAFDVISDVAMSAASQEYGRLNCRIKTYLTLLKGVTNLLLTVN